MIPRGGYVFFGWFVQCGQCGTVWTEWFAVFAARSLAMPL